MPKMKFYGDRPQSFSIDDSGERYYIGAEVGEIALPHCSDIVIVETHKSKLLSSVSF